MLTKVRTKHDVRPEVVDAVACTVKVKVTETLAHGLDNLLSHCALAVERVLAHRNWSSSKHYGDLVPCVVSKSLIAKYQKDPKCQRVQNLVIPVGGDQGKQIKLVEGGVRVPALFKKEVLPVVWPRPVLGHVRSRLLRKLYCKQRRRMSYENHDHRDANSGFCIAKRGADILSGGSSPGLSVSGLGPIGGSRAENLEAAYANN